MSVITGSFQKYEAILGRPKVLNSVQDSVLSASYQDGLVLHALLSPICFSTLCLCFSVAYLRTRGSSVGAAVPIASLPLPISSLFFAYFVSQYFIFIYSDAYIDVVPNC